jgi:two-component system chemotaxis response regulator CheB
MINRDSEILRPPFDIVAIAASLGGQKALIEVLSSLPQNFSSSVIVIQHLWPSAPEMLSRILRSRIKMRVRCAEDSVSLMCETVYTTPPGYYPLIDQNRALKLHPLVSRPIHVSADLLFESIATSCGERGIAVVLTGSGSDGARGIQSIKKAGGRVLVQDKRSSEHFGMPGAAIRTGAVDFVLPLNKIASALISLVMVEGAAELFRVVPRLFLNSQSR